MQHLKVILTNLVIWLLEKALIHWNMGTPDEHAGLHLPITVVYTNGEVEVLPLEREVKIGLDGVVYFKDRSKNKWIPYPEIVELVFTVRERREG